MKIESEVRESDILIILFTPSWLGSEFCRKEYNIFLEVEESCATTEFKAGYVAPILARNVTSESGSLLEEQSTVFNSIMDRQYHTVLASEFMILEEQERSKIIEKIADDILGIIERVRKFPKKAKSQGRRKGHQVSQPKREYTFQAWNFNDADFVSSAEVYLDRRQLGNCSVHAQVNFVERLYIQGEYGRVEFGIQRAYLKLANNGPGMLERLDELKLLWMKHNISYMSLHENPGAISICIDPVLGRTSLAELALPPAPNENYTCRVAVASDDVCVQNLSAELIISLNAEGIYFAENRGGIPSPRTKKLVKAIMEAVATKAATADQQSILKTGKLRRKIIVQERSGES